jgi:PhoH-like ATPase
MKKIFVLDTNVLLHDYECLYKFQDNDVVIPIMCLEELDSFKTGNNQINYNCREFTRLLDRMVKDQNLEKGVKISKESGKLFIRNIKNFSQNVKNSFHEPIVDHKILSLVEEMKIENSKKEVILVSKDINLRLKAKSLGLKSEDYFNDMIDNIEELLKRSIQTIETKDEKIIDDLYKNNEVVAKDYGIFKDTEIKENQNFIIKSDNKSILCIYKKEKLKRIEKINTSGIKPKNSEQTFALNALTDPDIRVVALTGTPGCGKTLLSLAASIEQQKSYDKIYISKSIVPMASQDVGFLKGTLDEKMEPQIQAFFDNLSVIKYSSGKNIGEKKTIEGEDKIEVSPLAYIRGRSLPNVYFIVDECQNLTKHEIKTIVTRIGEGSKIILCGDVGQIDSPFLDIKSNGLSQLVEKLSGQEFFSHINLVKSERSLVAEITSKLL